MRFEFAVPNGTAAGRSLPAAEARNSYPNMRAFRRLRPDRVANFSFLILHFSFAPVGRSGPQLRPGEGPHFASRRFARACPSQAATRMLHFLILHFEFLICDFVRSRRSPQPPPGGGLLLYVAGPSARLRACPEWDRCRRPVRQDRAGRSLGAAEARSSFTSQAYPPQTAARHGMDAKVRPEGPLNFES